MDVTIYHNPGCSNSRKALALIRERGLRPVVVEYLKTPLKRGELEALVGKLNIPLRDLMRSKEPVYAELNLDSAGEGALLDAIVAHPVLLNRPIVVTPKGAKLCRPGETVLELL
jgi:arsenate reductase